ESRRRQYYEHDHAQPDLITRDRRRSETGDDNDQTRPACGRYYELQNAHRRKPYELPQKARIEFPMPAADLYAAAFASEKQSPRGIQHSDAAADRRRDRRTGNAEFGKRADSENEHRIENDVHQICYHQNAQRDRRVARSAKYRIQQKQKYDHGV